MQHQTIKIWTSTLKGLRLISAHTGERMTVILDRIVQAELQRVTEEVQAVVAEEKQRSGRPRTAGTEDPHVVL